MEGDQGWTGFRRYRPRMPGSSSDQALGIYFETRCCPLQFLAAFGFPYCFSGLPRRCDGWHEECSIVDVLFVVSRSAVGVGADPGSLCEFVPWMGMVLLRVHGGLLFNLS
jgi:hypothetical protein